MMATSSEGLPVLAIVLYDDEAIDDRTAAGTDKSRQPWYVVTHLQSRVGSNNVGRFLSNAELVLPVG